MTAFYYLNTKYINFCNICKRNDNKRRHLQLQMAWCGPLPRLALSLSISPDTCITNNVKLQRSGHKQQCTYRYRALLNTSMMDKNRNRINCRFWVSRIREARVSATVSKAVGQCSVGCDYFDLVRTSYQ